MESTYIVTFILYVAMLLSSGAFVRLDDIPEGKANGIIQGGYWEDPEIEVYIDKDGELLYTNDSPVDLTEEAITVWNNVETSTFRFSVAGYMTRTEESKKRSQGEYMTFMYINDDDEICDEIGIDCGGILGFAQSGVADNSTDGVYVNSSIIINGKHPQMDSKQFLVTVTHEFGHFAGLDHVGNMHVDDTDYEYLPTLFPVSVNEIAQLSLAEDDIAGISAIYPNTEKYGEYGAIKGKVTDYFGNPVFGAYVVAYDATTKMPIISAMTGSPNCYTSTYKVEKPEEFIIPWIPPGNYIIGIESFPLYGGDQGNSNFVVVDEIRTQEIGSGIGIGDFGNFDYGFPTEYYPNASLSASATKITVEGGKVITDVDFVTGIDEEREGSVLVSIVHPKKDELEVTIEAENSYNCKKTITVTEDGSNLFSEYKISDIHSSCTDYLPPTQSNRWKLTVEDTYSYSDNIGEIAAFKIYYKGETYVSDSVSSESPYNMGSEDKKSIYIDGEAKESTSSTHSDKVINSYCSGGTSVDVGSTTIGGNISSGTNDGSGTGGGSGDVDDSACSLTMAEYQKPIGRNRVLGYLTLIMTLITSLSLLKRFKIRDKKI